MEVTPKLRNRLLIQNGIFVVLLVVFAALVAFFAREYRVEYDLTQSARNTLSQQTRDVLAKLGGPVKITVFATRQVEVRKPVQEFLAPYQRAKPDLAVTLVDPREEPKLAQAAAIRADGESVDGMHRRLQHVGGLVRHQKDPAVGAEVDAARHRDGQAQESERVRQFGEPAVGRDAEAADAVACHRAVEHVQQIAVQRQADRLVGGVSVRCVTVDWGDEYGCCTHHQ